VGVGGLVVSWCVLIAIIDIIETKNNNEYNTCQKKQAT